MDHTPGQRQWRDLAIFREYRRKKKGQVWSDQEFERYVEECRQRQRTFVPDFLARIGTASRAYGIPLASHDDTTVADVDEACAAGATLSEFPTTIEAARHAHHRGMRTVMGSPNVVLNGSHSGNVSARAMEEEGLLDILASDYVPSSLLQAIFLLGERRGSLPEAVATATASPADALALQDRGRIAPGLRADLIRVRLADGVPVVRGIWVAGRQLI